MLYMFNIERVWAVLPTWVTCGRPEPIMSTNTPPKTSPSTFERVPTRLNSQASTQVELGEYEEKYSEEPILSIGNTPPKKRRSSTFDSEKVPTRFNSQVTQVEEEEEEEYEGKDLEVEPFRSFNSFEPSIPVMFLHK